MFEKCRDPRHRQHHRFGAKGIQVCTRWEGFDAFCRWAADSGYQRGLWLARRDEGQGFSPSNCTWLEPRDARRQPRKGCKAPRVRWPITAFGETRSPPAWSRDRRCAVCYGTLLRRLHEGWDAEEALTHPPRADVGGAPPTTAVRAFGRTRSLAEWSRDPRCRVCPSGLRMRLLHGIAPEAAITTPRYQLPLRSWRKRSEGRTEGR